MRYELMLPHQIRRAIDERWPVVLPLGVLALPELRSLACSAWRVHAPEHRANTA
mgnify:CR=1 FL=1